MKRLIQIALLAACSISPLISWAGLDHAELHGPVTAKPLALAPHASLAEGLVKKVDRARGTITLKHGALPNGMPPMTMAYKVKDAAWFDSLHAGQEIRFATDPSDGGMTVLRIEPAK